MDKPLAILSMGGSVASIVGLLIVLLQLVGERAQIPAQYLLWRFIFAFVALVGAAAIAVSAYQVAQNVFTGQESSLRKTLKIALAVIVALLLIGICLDGLLAALYWNRMLPLFLQLINLARTSA